MDQSTRELIKVRLEKAEEDVETAGKRYRELCQSSAEDTGNPPQNMTGWKEPEIPQ
ncbi:MAG: hypothetical protein WC581_01665 [Thermodesulfovibrionales bacterium]